VSGAHARATPAFIALHIGLCALTWGFSFVCMKLMNGEVDIWTMAFARSLLAALAIGAWVMALGQMPWPDSRGEALDWIVLGSVNGWIPNILVAFALERMAAGMASMVQAATPMFTALFAHLLFADERLTPMKAAGIAVGFLGMLLLLGPRIGGGAELAGIAAMLGVVMAYGSGNIYARFRRAQRPERLALGQQGFSAIVSAALAAAIAGPMAIIIAFERHWLLLGVLGLVCTALPIALFMRLITRAGPTRASMVSYAAPATAVFMAVLVLGESLALMQVIGGLVIIAGVAMTTLARSAGGTR
jgi:drug/metabolite transporter (DMT)-like permease